MDSRLAPLLDQLRSPVLQAPMAGGPATPALAAAVHRAGGFGQLAGGNLAADALAGQLDELDRRLGGARTATDLLPVGVNLFVPDPDTADPAELERYCRRLEPVSETLGAPAPQVPPWSDDDYPAKVELLAARPAAVASFTFGLPGEPVVRRLQEAGSAVVLSVASADGARAAAQLAPDGLVVQGHQAGGHRAVLSMHEEPQPVDTVELVEEVARALAPTDDGGSALPLIAAGGVGSAADVDELLGAGAQAVQVGTQFLTAAEAGTRPAHRAAVLSAGEDATVVTRAFTGRPARGLRNRFIEQMDAYAVVGYPQVNQMTGPLRKAAAAAGDAAHLSLWAGTRTDACREETAGDVVARLTP